MTTNTKKYSGVTKTYSNLDQEVVEITTDRLRIILTNYINEYGKAQNWMTALGLLITILATLLTASFKEVFGVKADAWQAVFIVFLIISGIWLVKSLLKLYSLKGLEDILNEIKNQK